MTRDEIIALLGLQPHPLEGGYFLETYRSGRLLPPASGPAGLSHSLATAIYYLITEDAISPLHRLRGDEIFHFYAGDPVEMLLLEPESRGRVVILGTDLARGMRPQVLVTGGVWQGSRLLPGGTYALLGTTMAPGYDEAEYEAGHAAPLIAAYPEFRERILQLIK
jgi:uncharacterized protein